MKKISLTFFRYRFIFSFLSLTLFVFVFSFLCSLGIWQLHRADNKKKLLLDYNNRITLAPISLKEAESFEKPDFYSIQLKGHYDTSTIVLLDNRIYQHQVGYQVLVPFIPENSERHIWVNRGWLPRGKSRQELPKIESLNGFTVLKGMIHVTGKQPLTLRKNIEKMTVPFLRVQSLQIEALNQYLKENFYPFEVLLIQDGMKDENQWIRDWKPAIVVMPSRHVGYAVQWFGLALVFTVIFIVVHSTVE